MRVGVLFQLKGSKDIYKVVENTDANCNGCAGDGKKLLCKKLPFCYGRPPVVFSKLSSYEVRQVKKSKQFVEYIETNKN